MVFREVDVDIVVVLFYFCIFNEIFGIMFGLDVGGRS